jgi:hypothetical protein
MGRNTPISSCSPLDRGRLGSTSLDRHRIAEDQTLEPATLGWSE